MATLHVSPSIVERLSVMGCVTHVSSFVPLWGREELAVHTHLTDWEPEAEGRQGRRLTQAPGTQWRRG